MNDQPATTYDEMPYMNWAFPQTHPDRLATLARLFGLTPHDLETCRVLELGCASGDNLIPMAVALPNARFVGIDFSDRQIEHGKDIVRSLELSNIELRCVDIADVDQSWGRFHYIVCHGIYSWVPQPIREKILEICRDNLAPEGVAYVSYNTLPGWHVRGMVRGMMMYHTEGAQNPAVKVQQGRALLQFLAQTAVQNTAYSMALRQEQEGIQGEPDTYVFHEHLEPTNDPFYFHQFMDAARRYGLQYLGEANFSQMLMSEFPPQVGETLRRIAPDVLRMEQYMDFVRNRSFRQTLLVHQGIHVNRNLAGQVVNFFYVTSRAQLTSPTASLAEGVTETVRAPNGATIATSNAVTKAAIALLAERWPLGFSFDQLVQEARAKLVHSGLAVDPATLARDTRVLGGDLLHCYAADTLELRVRAPGITLAPSAQPLASPLARLQAERGLSITNLRHEPVALDDFGSRLLRLLDGTRDRQALAAQMSELGNLSGTSIESNVVEIGLHKLGRLGLLVS